MIPWSLSHLFCVILNRALEIFSLHRRAKLFWFLKSFRVILPGFIACCVVLWILWYGYSVFHWIWMFVLLFIMKPPDWWDLWRLYAASHPRFAEGCIWSGPYDRGTLWLTCRGLGRFGRIGRQQERMNRLHTSGEKNPIIWLLNKLSSPIKKSILPLLW